ncbi:MAG: UDP-N-acetylmuramate: L-alanyl-gamma-D-glutamyl-meso-diaminopimelate ligase [Bradymonadia bacterium]|jgi:UDP-N-acetylmuramate: L-alanyl-gamma-D-glutamyl-meso-diaminopimelate ligase
MTAADKRPFPRLPALESIRRIHVIGICGTAMGTLAAMLRERGYEVSGSDAMAYPPMSTWLEARGLTIQSGYEASHIPENVHLVVVGNVSRRDNPEAVATRERGLPYLSLPETLRAFFFPEKQVLTATGTHGKTTTSSMASWILHATSLEPSFFIGGVTVNFDSNYRLGSGDWFVVEGDEYDTAYFDKVPKFWHYPAHTATINNVEFDHADIYPDLDSIRHVFSRFAEQIPDDGTLWVNGDDQVARACAAHATAPVRTFGLSEDYDIWGQPHETNETGLVARIGERGTAGFEIQLPTIGTYNLRNFLGACGLVSAAGVSLEQAAEAIRSFEGVKKRQQHKGTVDDIFVIDDFAHHPTAVASTLSAIRERFPTRRVWAIFEAKSNTSRRAVFQNQYPPAFVDADVVVLSQPWKKDDLPESERISIPQMVKDIEALGKRVLLIPGVDEIVELLSAECRPGDVVAGLSGSSFGGLHDKVLDALRERG